MSQYIISIGALLYFQEEFKSPEGIWVPGGFSGRANDAPGDSRGQSPFW